MLKMRKTWLINLGEDPHMRTPHLIMEGAQNRTLLVLFCSFCLKLIENLKMPLIVINTKQKKLQARSSIRFVKSLVNQC